TILIVDERALVRRTIALALKSEGHSTLEAANGSQAMDLLRKNPDVNLIIATIEMAGMSGIELARQLKADDRYHSIPVILRTRGEDLQSGTLQGRVETLLEEKCPRPRQVLVLSTSTETKSQLRSALSEIGFRVFEVRSADEAAQA